MELMIIHNIASAYYKNIVFNALFAQYKNFKVVHIAETEDIREWEIFLSEIRYPYEILFRGSIDSMNAILTTIKLVKIVSKDNPEVVYIGGYKYLPYWFALIWARLRGKKVIIEMNSSLRDKPRYFIKELIKKLLIKMCDFGLVYSEISKEYLMKLGMSEKQIKKKPNVTDNSLFERKANPTKPKEFLLTNNILFVGRLSNEKNLIFALEAFNDAINITGDNNWGFIVVGDGPLKNKVEQFIESKSMDNVFIAGFVKRDELLNYYWNSSILLLPSISEPWGLVVNEAMASSLPVLVSNRCGCQRDLVKEGVNGFSFDPLDRNHLTTKIKEIVEGKYDLYKMGYASKEIIKSFTPEKAAQVIFETIGYVI